MLSQNKEVQTSAQVADVCQKVPALLAHRSQAAVAHAIVESVFMRVIFHPELSDAERTEFQTLHSIYSTFRKEGEV